MIGLLLLSALCQTEPVKVSTPATAGPVPPYAGEDYVDLEVLVRQYQVTWISDALTGREIVKGASSVILLAPALGVAIVNGVPEKLQRPVILLNGRIRLPIELVHRIESGARRRSEELRPPVPSREKEEPRKSVAKFFKIVIDPGHGGRHTGGKGRTGLMEKTINLDVSKRLQRLLEERGGDVVLTRVDDRHFDEDVDDDLNRRADLVNRVRPDLFVSVHTNYVPSPEPRGFEVWISRDATGARDRSSRELAALMRKALAQAIGSEDRGTKESGFRVLQRTQCTAVLVELEFISNPQAERLLASDGGRQQMAQALADAIQRYMAGKK